MNIVVSVMLTHSIHILNAAGLSSFHHTSHLFFGFIFDALGQENSWENSGRFDSGPITRNRAGEWGSFSICKFVASSVLEEHHTYKTNYNNYSIKSSFLQQSSTFSIMF